MTHKAIGFDRRMPEVDFDALDLPATATLPVAREGEDQKGSARTRQQPRHPISTTDRQTSSPEAENRA
jgi:hypothetical protein